MSFGKVLGISPLGSRHPRLNGHAVQISFYSRNETEVLDDVLLSNISGRDFLAGRVCKVDAKDLFDEVATKRRMKDGAMPDVRMRGFCAVDEVVDWEVVFHNAAIGFDRKVCM